MAVQRQNSRAANSGMFLDVLMPVHESKVKNENFLRRGMQLLIRESSFILYRKSATNGVHDVGRYIY